MALANQLPKRPVPVASGFHFIVALSSLILSRTSGTRINQEDGPCSGLGIIRKKPDIRYKNLEELKALPALQLAILENQAAYVKKGGVLIYSTCTVLKRENEDIVRAFLEKHDDYYLEPLELPAVFPKNETGMLTLIPGEYDTDGFFISRLRRKA